MVLEEMSKMWKANDGRRTDDGRQAMAQADLEQRLG